MTEGKKIENPDFETLFQLYYPVIAAARKVRDRYTPIVEEDGKKKRKATIVCPDETAVMIEALNKAESVMNVEQSENKPDL